jgi:hypothetical protein
MIVAFIRYDWCIIKATIIALRRIGTIFRAMIVAFSVVAHNSPVEPLIAKMSANTVSSAVLNL